jgi:sugar phosphate permease
MQQPDSSGHSAAVDPAAPRLFYGWVVVGITAFVLLFAAGVRVAPGAFLLDMVDSTGWSRAALSFSAGVGLVVYGLTGPAAGQLMLRLGIRRVAVVALLVTAAALALTSLVREVWQLVLVFGLLSGIGTGLVASVLGAAVASRWFVRHRGLVVGIFGAASSAGQLVFYPLLALLVEGSGWRGAALVVAGCSLALVIPAALLIRDDPADLGVRALGEDPAAASARAGSRAGADPGVMRRAVRSSDFWLLAGTFFVCGFSSNGIVGQHFIAHAADHGFTPLVASQALALMGAFNFAGTIASGWLTDRVDPRRLLLVYYLFRGVSLLTLPWIHDSLGIVAFAVLFGLDYIATVPPTIALCADVFGRRNVGVVYGWVFAAHMIGAAIAAWGAGLVRDGLGTYGPAFIGAGALAGLAAIAVLGIRRPVAGGGGDPLPAEAAAAA